MIAEPTPDPTHELAIRRFTLVAIVAPLVFVAIGVVIQLLALPHVPETIAVHWNAAGEPNRYAPAWTQPILTILFGAGIPLLIGLTARTGLRRGDRGATYRLMGATAAAVATLITVAFTWTLLMQAGDAAEAKVSIWPALWAALGSALVVGVIAWFVQPKEDRVRSAAEVSPIALAAGERVVWLRTTSMVPGATVALVLGIVVLGAAAFATWLGGGADTLVLLLLLVTLVVAIAAATTLAFHVRIDDSGLSVRSVVGIPRWRIPLDHIAAVARVEVNPMGEFGGWGPRWGAGRRFGLILRTGEAIEVTRTNGRGFVVTVEDAGTGAGLLAALLQRQHA